MKIVLLGTGTSQGVPVITCSCSVCQSPDPRDKRLRSAALVTDSGGNNILIDIGPDFRCQMLAHSVKHLDAILVTHAHRDHVGGIDDIRPFNWAQQGSMELFANSNAINMLRHDYKYIFEYHKYPGLPEVNLHDVSDALPFRVGRTTVTPVRGMHKDLPVLGYRLADDDGSRMAYVTDMNHINPEELLKLNNLDLLVVNALRKEKHFSHFSLPEALEVVRHCKPRRAFLTHISHEMGLHSAVDPSLPDGVHLAYDNLEIEI